VGTIGGNWIKILNTVDILVIGAMEDFSTWTAYDVADWVKSKGFDQNLCDKVVGA
jgi:hypothetical protein